LARCLFKQATKRFGRFNYIVDRTLQPQQVNHMKTNRMFLLLFLMAGIISVNAQTTTLESEVPGDNFSLEGALELFKKSASPEEFERKLNASDSRVNNLDLNNDGDIDYIRVIDRNEGNVHAFILQAVLSNTESQDVAVIELEKLEDGRAVLQIVGDADVYGIETIIEPTEEVRVNAGAMTSRAVVNVWTWPSVQYVYSPYYSVWVSPWSWAYHPFWWRPWRPVAFYIYHPWWTPYRPYYSYCYSHRVFYGPGFYSPYRRTSVIVYNNYGRQIDGYRSRNDRYHNGRRDRDGYGRHDGGRFESGRYVDRRSGYSGRERSDGRDRFADSRRSISATGSRDNSRSRFEGNTRSSTSERRSVSGGRTGSESGRSRTIAPNRNIERSSGDFKSSPNRTERSSTFDRSRSQERTMRQAPSQQRSTPSYSNPGRQQRSSSPSYNGGGSSGSRPSFNGGGGSRSSGSGTRSSGGGGRSSGGGDRGNSGNSRGRH
jgi:hypothetical protein